MAVVKKQNIVREYVCCMCAATKDPIHVQERGVLIYAR